MKIYNPKANSKKWLRTAPLAPAVITPQNGIAV